MKRLGYAIAGVALFAAGLALSAQAEEQCTDGACFTQAAETCTGAVFETDAHGEIGARGRYRVLGAEDSGACKLEFVFTENPNPAYVGKPLTFLIDPSTVSEEALQSVVAACLSGGEAWYQCEGPLLEEIGGASSAETFASGSGPLPCGAPVEESGPVLYPMPKEGKWGYVDRAGSWKIPPRWDRAGEFHEGRAMVGSPSGWGIIDGEGKEIVPPQFKGASFVTIGEQNWYGSPFSPFSEGCSVVTQFTDETQPSFFIDRTGKAYWRGADRPRALRGRDVERFGVFSQGLAWFREGHGENARYGWIDADGTVAIAAEFEEAGRFSDGLAFAAVRDGQGAYVSPEGSPVLPRKWTLHQGHAFSEGLAKVSTTGHDTAYWTQEDVAFDEVDFGAPQGDRPAEAEISREAGAFRDGLAPAITGFLYGDDFVYVGPDGAVAFVPDEIEGITVCNRRALPEFRHGLVRLVVADDGENCGDGRYTMGLAQYDDAHYVYLDTAGQIVLRQEK